MKIQVYKVQSVRPTGNDYENYCEIFGLPTLKFGIVQVLGELSHIITKSELRKIQKVNGRLYDPATKSWRHGCFLMTSPKTFVEVIN